MSDQANISGKATALITTSNLRACRTLGYAYVHFITLFHYSPFRQQQRERNSSGLPRSKKHSEHSSTRLHFVGSVRIHGFEQRYNTPRVEIVHWVSDYLPQKRCRCPLWCVGCGGHAHSVLPTQFPWNPSRVCSSNRDTFFVYCFGSTCRVAYSQLRSLISF